MQMQLDLNYVSHPALSHNAYLVGLSQCLFAISFFQDLWNRGCMGSVGFLQIFFILFDSLFQIGDNSIPAGQGSDNEIEDSLTGGGGGGQENEFQVLPGSLFNCPAPGFYPFETNCKEFYVCLEVLPNVLAAGELIITFIQKAIYST